MRLGLTFLLTCFFLIAPLFGQAKPESSTSPAITIEDFGWIAGCWRKNWEAANSFTMEHWSKPAGMMVGFNRRVKSGEVEFFEYFRIVRKEARFVYIVKPATAKTETEFVLTSLVDKTAVFENPEHDFPQRIVYKLADKETIEVRVEAEKDGKVRGFGFPMKKVGCDSN